MARVATAGELQSNFAESIGSGSLFTSFEFKKVYPRDVDFSTVTSFKASGELEMVGWTAFVLRCLRTIPRGGEAV